MEQKVTQGINAYLIDGPNLLVKKRMRPISPQLPRAFFGSKPTDGGNLIVEATEFDTVAADPIAAKYLRPFRMGRELIRGLDRWCLWMADDNFDPDDIQRSAILRERIQSVQNFRAASKKEATRRSAETPHLFQENHQPDGPYVGIPRVVSESRSFYTVQRLNSEVIAGDKVYVAEDPDGLLFSLISSSMFITWQEAVGGRLESRLSFANTLTWNTFPVPELTHEQRQAIVIGGEKVLEARALHPERSLADHYNPLSMSPELLDAHHALDQAVDAAFGAPQMLENEKERLEILFSHYSALTRACLLYA